jgi:hypothetical protein
MTGSKSKEGSTTPSLPFQVSKLLSACSAYLCVSHLICRDPMILLTNSRCAR